MMGRPLLGLLAAGWIAHALASTDGEVDAGVEAYEAGDYEQALAHFDAAQERLGERPEIHYDRGLALQAAGKADEAREAFERGTEADETDVRASSNYQLGNLAFDGEQWDEAIANYIACLRAMPQHENAKWNLELALQRKQKQEEEEEKEKEKEDEEKQDGDQQDEEKKDEEKQDGDKQDEEKQDEEKQDEEKQDEEKQDEDKQDQDEAGEQEPQPEPQAIDQADIDAALEQLDAADEFMLGRPVGRPPQVEKDW